MDTNWKLCAVTNVDAIFSMPPDKEGAKRIPFFDANADVEIGMKSSMGRGGMLAKINAAK